MLIDKERTIEQFMLVFLNDASEALKRCDRQIRDKFLSSHHKETFYRDYGKGLDTWSATEIIAKFLLYIELCPKYRIRPEDWGYKDSKLLDFAMYVQTEDDSEIPDVGVEMKWARFTREGKLTSDSLQLLVDDFVKIKKAVTPYKFLMQFAVNDPEIKLDFRRLNQQIEKEIDGRLLRKMIPVFFGTRSFSIASSERKQKNFTTVLWRVVEKY
ncbi:MAG: hypothetical protein CVV03_11580 [Firmicutes bacterium HGW-Firmicutes-8]|nr:MAG: hypothetical protein CVV03_11580 [Firmicutes bacterium HGW-Firmicutes-8]